MINPDDHGDRDNPDDPDDPIAVAVAVAFAVLFLHLLWECTSGVSPVIVIMRKS